MLRYMVTSPALKLDDHDTTTNDVVAIRLYLAVLQYYLRSIPGKVLLSSDKCFSFVGFNERRNHRRSRTSHLCPNGLLTNVIVKRALAAAQCVFINDARTQSMPTQSGVNIAAISSSTCIISTAPAADALA
ncbi:uncharacterized protein TNCT_362451 [Trichonephila clavata]|uniref:Uncharacterized protein n=1 Tax=Trichonephila clavata TaxID=2740835 RepID=A0A8X6FKK1_TRICU|nr:uncharacterized protein TNCT_362451 [Trichonephila clavata]